MRVFPAEHCANCPVNSTICPSRSPRILVATVRLLSMARCLAGQALIRQPVDDPKREPPDKPAQPLGTSFWSKDVFTWGKRGESSWDLLGVLARQSPKLPRSGPPDLVTSFRLERTARSEHIPYRTARTWGDTDQDQSRPACHF
ncbi:hypothetical protein CALVIDRAFT_276879 [Calocera viscosa TUFC12733]|uniref:Uncharacterized protein n=1 Tax=Calocera viscosa (strain TUFC12733) TaxID=1330018 RepID=A0A167R206_CALVF|nr:hypothetical protein CALVIDRAFT_276879 [Calocera viscosa TUFC12733]